MLADEVIGFVLAAMGHSLGVDLANGSTVTGAAIGHNERGLWIAGRKAGVQGEYLLPYDEITYLRRRQPLNV